MDVFRVIWCFAWFFVLLIVIEVHVWFFVLLIVIEVHVWFMYFLFNPVAKFYCNDVKRCVFLLYRLSDCGCAFVVM